MECLLVFFAVLMMLLTCEAIPLVYRKRYDDSLRVACPGCQSDAVNECSIRMNGIINTTAGTTLQNGHIVLRPRDWGVYGTICCGSIHQQPSCHRICPQYSEVCEDCLMLSANVTSATVGDVIMITSSISQQPHNGISLLINGSINGSTLECHTTSHVLGSQVLFYCIARKSGTVIIQSNVVFCDVDLTSQQINITIEEQRNETEAIDTPPPSTSVSTTPPPPSVPSSATISPTITTDQTTNTVSINITTPSVSSDTKGSTAKASIIIITMIILFQLY